MQAAAEGAAAVWVTYCPYYSMPAAPQANVQLAASAAAPPSPLLPCKLLKSSTVPQCVHATCCFCCCSCGRCFYCCCISCILEGGGTHFTGGAPLRACCTAVLLLPGEGLKCSDCRTLLLLHRCCCCCFARSSQTLQKETCPLVVGRHACR